MLRSRVRVAGELYDHRRQADTLDAEGGTPWMPRIELKARREGHCLAMLCRAAGMLEEEETGSVYRGTDKLYKKPV
jgi:hypothetical protein